MPATEADMQQRSALITGAASGIGQAATLRLHARGMQVLLVDRNEAVHQVAAALGPRARARGADLADAAQIEALCDAELRTGGCDILVNNAGIHPKRNGFILALEEISLDEWEQVLRVTVTAAFLLSRSLLGPMKERGWGRIINIASRAGRTWSDRAGTHYSTSKAALIGLTRKLGGDYARYGITANCICPGQIDTALARSSDASVLQHSARSAASGRIGTADEVASMIEYLCEDAAGFTTGARGNRRDRRSAVRSPLSPPLPFAATRHEVPCPSSSVPPTRSPRPSPSPECWWE